MALCRCGGELSFHDQSVGLCAACLLRVGLEPAVITASASDVPARVLGPIGAGPHGTVYLAVRPDDVPEHVTVKVIEAATDGSMFCEFLEAIGGTLDSLRHPAVAAPLQVGVTAAGLPYVVAAYIPGASLKDYMRHRQANVAARAILAGRLCSVLADLHDAGIVHGSLKPTNVIVAESTDGPCPILLDTAVLPAIEYGSGSTSVATKERDCKDLHILLGGLIGHLSGLIAGTESPGVLADLFIQRPE